MIHVAVALRVRAAGLPEGGHLRERHGFLAEHADLFIDLKPRYLALLKEYVARLLLLCGVENAVDVLLHGCCNFYHTGADKWQTLLTDESCWKRCHCSFAARRAYEAVSRLMKSRRILQVAAALAGVSALGARISGSN